MNDKIFRLDNQIDFIPSKNLLTHKDGSTLPATLTTPASKILQLLLLKKELVTQDYIFSNAWDNNGAHVTPNNLYQSISHLRRALKIISGKDERAYFIVTVPKIGFYFNTDIHVEELSPTNADITDKSTDTPKQVDRVTKDNEKFSHFNAASIEVLNDVSPKKEIDRKLKADRKSQWLPSTLFIVIMGLIVTLAIALFLDNSTSTENNYFKSYTLFKKDKQCYFLIMKNINLSDSEVDNVIQMISPLKCNTRPFNYISFIAPINNVSVISCKSDLFTMQRNSKQCVSSYYYGLIKK